MTGYTWIYIILARWVFSVKVGSQTKILSVEDSKKDVLSFRNNYMSGRVGTVKVFNEDGTLEEVKSFE